MRGRRKLAWALLPLFVTSAATAIVAVACGIDISGAGPEGSRPDGNLPDGTGLPPPADGSWTIDGGDGGPVKNSCRDAAAYPNTWLADPKLCLSVYAEGFAYPRQMAFAPNGDLFVQAAGKIFAFFDENGDGIISYAPKEYQEFVGGTPALNHGLAFSADNAFLYASNDTTVYRWPYTSGQRVATNGSIETVIKNIPQGLGHIRHALTFDAQGNLYLNVGSRTDVDIAPDDIAQRSQVRRFAIPAAVPAGGIDYALGEIFARGLRNEMGIGWDSKNRMWGVENGSDGLGPDNPAEELNRLDAPGSRQFGYPFCWTEFALDGGLGRGTQWAYVPNADGRDDAWCRDPNNVQKPAAAMQGHWAPLGVSEYTGNSLPWKGDLVIAAHGSSSRSPAVGRLLARAHLTGDTVESVTPLVGGLAADGGLSEGTWNVRPVDVRTGPDGALYFSDDLGHRIFRVGYRP